MVAFEDQSKSVSEALQRGLEYLEGGFPLAAIQELEFALIENKYLWDAYYYLAKAYLQRAKEISSPEALWQSYHLLQTLEVLNPEYSEEALFELHRELERTFDELGLVPVDEVAVAEAALLEDPHETLAHRQLAKRRREGPKTRIRRFRQVVESDPANLLALGQLARAYEDTESYLMAQSIYEQMLQYTLGLELNQQFFESSPSEQLEQAVRWWSEQAPSGGEVDQESLELMRAMHRLSKLFLQRGELERAHLLFSGALDLAIHMGALPALKPYFNDYLDLCIRVGRFHAAHERLPYMKRTLAELGDEEGLDPLLLSLVESYQTDSHPEE